MNKLALLLNIILIVPKAANAHCYSVWHYSFPQHCNSASRVAQIDPNKPTSILPFPLPKPVPSVPLYIEEWDPMPGTDITIPLPSLEHMEFPPDCLTDWCQRLKGVAKLRELRGTN